MSRVRLASDNATGCDVDLNAFSSLLGSNGKTLFDQRFVFYDNSRLRNNAVEDSGNDRTGTRVTWQLNHNCLIDLGRISGSGNDACRLHSRI